MSNYKIEIDRDGSPYLSHAWGARSGGYNRTAPVKYIAKIGEGAQAKYFYTQDQLRAFQQGARYVANNAATNARRTANKVGSTVSSNARYYGRNASSAVKNTANRALNDIKYKAKYNRVTGTARRIKNAVDSIQVTRNENPQKKPALTPEQRAAQKARNKENWDRSKQLIKDAAKYQIDEKYGYKIRNAQRDIENAKRDIENKKNAVKNKASEVKDKATEAKSKLESTSDRMKAEFQKKKTERDFKRDRDLEVKELQRMERQEKISDAKEKAKNKVDAAKEKVDSAKEKAKEAVDAYKDYQKEATAETYSELKKHPTAHAAEMARRKVAEAQENAEYAASEAKEKLEQAKKKLKKK